MDKLTVLKTEWLITRKCNFQCGYCKVRNNEFPNELDLEGRKRVLDVISTVAPKTAVVIFGGEPLTLGDDLVEVVRYGNQKELYMIVISNSSKLDDVMLDKLYDAGLRNWSVSIDTIKGNTVDKWTLQRAKMGLDACLRAKKKGFNDLVTCTTVTKYNLAELPEMTKQLTEMGIWSIHTLLQKAGPEYNYSQPYEMVKEHLVNDRELVRKISHELYVMAKSGKYLMHNPPEYYLLWEDALENNIKCSTKSTLTVDADGSLMRCVDCYNGLNKFKVFDLLDENKVKEYIEELKKPPSCSRGSFWDPCIGTTIINELYGSDLGKAAYKHEVGFEKLEEISGQKVDIDKIKALFEWNKVI